MDKREFYKQLMENYTIDTEKVKCNAKRRYRTQSTGRLHKWTAGIAACTAVAAVATITVVSINNLPRSGMDITDSSIESAMERLRAADQRYLELSAEQEAMDIYVSLSKNLSRNEILMAFSALEDFSDIKISYLYTEKGKRYENSENTDSSLLFRGAKITAPTHLYKDLKELKAIAYLEPVEGSEYNDDTFVPINIPPDVVNNTVSTDQTIQISLPENTLMPETTDISTEGTTAAENEGTGESTASETTDISSETGVSEKSEILIPVPNIIYADFINENQVVVTTDDSIRLCRLSENNEVQIETTFYANSAKISWSSSNHSRMFITACDDKGRNKLFFADGESGTLSEIDVSALTAGGYEISSVICNDMGSAMVIKTVSIDKSFIYYASRNGNAMQVVLSKEFGCPVSVLCCNTDSIYTLVTNPVDSSMSITRVSVEDGNANQSMPFKGSVKFNRNISLDMAIITETTEEGEKNYLLDNAGNCLPLNCQNAAFSPIDGRAIRLDSKFYFINGGEWLELSEYDARFYFDDSVERNRVSTHSVSINSDGTAYILVKDNQ